MTSDRGLFVTFEGGDGVGKTTQREILVGWLREHGRAVLETREPGGTEIGVVIRNLLLHHPGPIDARAEALLYAADRAHHSAMIVRPALDEGRIVVQDRYIDSSVAYQGAGRVLQPEEIRRLSEWATNDLRPDLTILLDLDRDTAGGRLEAAAKGFDRLEGENNAFHDRVRQAFLDIAAHDPERFLTIDASLPIDVIALTIRERVQKLCDDAAADGFVRGGR